MIASAASPPLAPVERCIPMCATPSSNSSNTVAPIHTLMVWYTVCVTPTTQQLWVPQTPTTCVCVWGGGLVGGELWCYLDYHHLVCVKPRYNTGAGMA